MELPSDSHPCTAYLDIDARKAQSPVTGVRSSKANTDEALSSGKGLEGQSVASGTNNKLPSSLQRENCDRCAVIS